jgi:hypothetical protein
MTSMSRDTPLRDFAALRKRMEERQGGPVAFDEGMWTLCNERAGKLIEESDYLKLRKLYLHMAEYLNREGRDSFCVLEEAARAQLYQYSRRDRPAPMEIVCADDACDPCRRQEGKRLTAGEALESMPLPHKQCAHRPAEGNRASFCRCRYRERDR